MDPKEDGNGLVAQSQDGRIIGVGLILRRFHVLIQLSTHVRLREKVPFVTFRHCQAAEIRLCYIAR